MTAPTSATTAEIGRITDEGLWVVTGAEADALPLGSAVVKYAPQKSYRAAGQPVARPLRGDVLGAQILGAQVKVDVTSEGGQAAGNVAWVGVSTLGDALRPDALYRVLWPLPVAVRLGTTLPSTREEFEAALASSRRGDASEVLPGQLVLWGESAAEPAAS